LLLQPLALLLVLALLMLALLMLGLLALLLLGALALGPLWASQVGGHDLEKQEKCHEQQWVYSPPGCSQTGGAASS
jgi:hypothetical protein